MPLFRRKPPASDGGDAAELLLQGHDMIQQTAAEHHRSWGLGVADRWDLDQDSGLLRWTFPDRVAEAPVQVLGSYSPADTSWLWAWANRSLMPPLRAGSEAVRDWGTAHGQAALVTSSVAPCSPEQAADLAALAFRITRATGFYRGTGPGPAVFLTFGVVTINRADGTSTTFRIGV